MLLKYSVLPTSWLPATGLPESSIPRRVLCDPAGQASAGAHREAHSGNPCVSARHGGQGPPSRFCDAYRRPGVPGWAARTGSRERPGGIGRKRAGDGGIRECSWVPSNSPSSDAELAERPGVAFRAGPKPRPRSPYRSAPRPSPTGRGVNSDHRGPSPRQARRPDLARPGGGGAAIRGNATSRACRDPGSLRDWAAGGPRG